MDHPRTEAEQARLDAALVDLFQDKIAFNAVLGLRIDSVAPDDVRASFAMKPELVGHYTYGRLHGGVTAAVLDAMGGLALMVAIAARHPHDNTLQVMQRFAKMGTIDLRVDYLRQGLGQRFVATAAATHVGLQIGRTQMALSDDAGRLLATGAAAYVIG